MDPIAELIAAARRAPGGRVALPESGEPRILAAARRLAEEGIARPLLVGEPEETARAAAEAGVDLAGIEVLAPRDPERIERYAAIYRARRPGARPGVAERFARRALYHAALMVAAGEADALVAGAAQPTARVIEAGMLCIGPAPGIATPSSFFLMVVPGRAGRPARRLLFADCAVNVEPDAGQLADIAIASAASARALLGEEPRVALLSLSTRGSARHARVEKVAAAVALARERAPELAIDGELQADAALDAAVAARKLGEPGEVAGRANVLVFPDLDAGNIGYKLVAQLAGAQAVGPVLQGFARPVSDLSRGASVEEVVGACAIALALGGAR